MPSPSPGTSSATWATNDTAESTASAASASPRPVAANPRVIQLMATSLAESHGYPHCAQLPCHGVWLPPPMIGKVPTSVCDIFDLKTFPGKRALEKRPKKNLEWALICDGVAKEDLYDVLSTPEGVDRAPTRKWCSARPTTAGSSR